MTIEDIAKLLDKKIAGLVTKEDLRQFATKDDLQRFATKEDLRQFATKDDLQRFATKEDLRELKHEFKLEIQELSQKIDELIETQAIIVGEHVDRFKRLEKHAGLPPYKSIFRRSL